MISNVTACFEELFSHRAQYVFSSPGRTELGGNHTDHQHGLVLAAAVDMETTAAVAPNGLREIRLHSKGYSPVRISLDELDVHKDETGTTAALIRGVAAGFARRGCEVQGFDAYVDSEIASGSGLSSSAAFENLIGCIVSRLSGAEADAVTLAQISKEAENEYFGKPCGLMDQLASACGGMISIDLGGEQPVIERVKAEPGFPGYDLYVIDSGSDHADLTDEYGAITKELGEVCAMFGKRYLRDVPEEEFSSRLCDITSKLGCRHALRAMHVYDENRRVIAQKAALESGDIEGFLRISAESGRSSWMYLQNVIASGTERTQRVAYALAVAERLLHGRGACRVHGGGFAGTIQAFVPCDMSDDFRREMDRALGRESCAKLSVVPYGTRLVTIL